MTLAELRQIQGGDVVQMKQYLKSTYALLVCTRQDNYGIGRTPRTTWLALEFDSGYPFSMDLSVVLGDCEVVMRRKAS